jgi:hypothetical protein
MKAEEPNPHHFGPVNPLSDVRVDGKPLEEVRSACQHFYAKWNVVDGRPTRVCRKCGHKQVEKPNEEDE